MLLDSNILIYAVNRSAPEVESLAIAEESAVASVTQIEVYGFTGLKTDEKAALDILFHRLTVHPLEAKVIDRAIALRRENKIGLADAIIAATAPVHDLPLVTRNEADFRHITGLRIVNPFAGG